MGCFSYICKECGKGIRSSSFDGENVKLWLLKDGQIIEEMEGPYDSYGRVFVPGSQRLDVQRKLPVSREWKMPWSGVGNSVCDLIFSEADKDGIAAIHTKCFTGNIPTTQSKDDPNQGWGEDGELMGSVATSGLSDE